MILDLYHPPSVPCSNPIHGVFFFLVERTSSFVPAGHLHVLMGPAVVEALITVQKNHATKRNETNFSAARCGPREHKRVIMRPGVLPGSTCAALHSGAGAIKLQLQIVTQECSDSKSLHGSMTTCGMKQECKRYHCKKKKETVPKILYRFYHTKCLLQGSTYE